MPQLFCVLEDGGRSLLTRAQGGIQLPSFPTLGLLSSIATYSEGAGYQLQTFGSASVRVVYRRCENQLLLLLATSNLLVQAELLQVLLGVVYDGIVLLIGAPALLQLDTAPQIDTLRKKLRNVPSTSIDCMIADETLVPCLMLGIPQATALPLRDRSVLTTALTRAAAELGSKHAALLGEGYYLAATAAWWALLPREQLLLQHLATYESYETGLDLPVFLCNVAQSVAATTARAASNTINITGAAAGAAACSMYMHDASGSSMCRARLLSRRLSEGVHLLVLVDADAESAMFDPCMASASSIVQGVRHAYETPLWMTQPMPQFSRLSFDLAMVVERGSPTRATLLWGHSGGHVPQGFNPLMSPTLRKQLATSTGSGSLSSPRTSAGRALAGVAGGGSGLQGGGGLRAVSLHRSVATTAADNLQLFFKSSLDTLVSFMLQVWPHTPAGAAQCASAGAPLPAGGSASKPLIRPTAATATTPASAGLASGAGTAQQGQQQPGHSRVPGLSAVGRLARAFVSAPNSPPGKASPTQPKQQGAVAPGVVGSALPSTAGAGMNGAPVLSKRVYGETHMVVEASRLIALTEHAPTYAGSASAEGVDVFVCMPKRVSRAAALETAEALRETFLTSCCMPVDTLGGAAPVE